MAAYASVKTVHVNLEARLKILHRLHVLFTWFIGFTWIFVGNPSASVNLTCTLETSSTRQTKSKKQNQAAKSTLLPGFTESKDAEHASFKYNHVAFGVSSRLAEPR